MYGKRTARAIAGVARLAEVYDEGYTRLSTSNIATARGFSQPIVAKVLSVLSQAGLAQGSPGPGGGFTLARDPGEISLFEVFRLFERVDADRECPFGAAVCGVGEVCPLHERLADVHAAMDRLLHETTFAVFHRRPEAPTPGRHSETGRSVE
jgi:Rrf2 family iron-sulfur cluster assembly transcriptional regulator